jgi:hypothetical protein
MNTKQLTLILTVAAATTLGTLNLNAAAPAVSPTAKSCCSTAVPATTADANLAARNSEAVASPKAFANFPYLAGGHKAQPAKTMAACACCKQ